MDLADNGAMAALFAQHQFDLVVNLAAQAGVRYSVENPRAYIDSNVVGFLNILKAVAITTLNTWCMPLPALCTVQ